MSKPKALYTIIGGAQFPCQCCDLISSSEDVYPHVKLWTRQYAEKQAEEAVPDEVPDGWRQVVVDAREITENTARRALALEFGLEGRNSVLFR